MRTVFSGKNIAMEADVENYLNRISDSSLIFVEGIKAYLSNKRVKFEEYYQEIRKVESQADEIRRDIKQKLYTYMLIPESRGDVLGLLETLDDVVDMSEKVLEQFSIEKPVIIPELIDYFWEITELSSKCVEQLVKAARAFFKEIKLVNEYVNKVHFYEHEVDKVEEKLKREAFQSDKIKHFSQKVNMRYFCEKIAKVSDIAEDVAERISVYAIKRRL
ncbi:MAG: DUF47 family protein [Candidatus Cloacimonadota bacterium]|nr:DUF47 family protein [Candidatus Cloacimonadota bacterium]